MCNKISRIVILFILSVLIISCKPRIEEEIVSTYPNGNTKKIEVYKITGKEKEMIKEIHFFKNGNKQTEGEFANGNKQGNWTYWYESGTVWSKGRFENNLREGETLVYHKNGQLNYTGFYKKGKPDGEWKFYDQNEEVKKIVIYEKGKIVKDENLNIPYN